MNETIFEQKICDPEGEDIISYQDFKDLEEGDLLVFIPDNPNANAICMSRESLLWWLNSREGEYGNCQGTINDAYNDPELVCNKYYNLPTTQWVFESVKTMLEENPTVQIWNFSQYGTRRFRRGGIENVFGICPEGEICTEEQMETTPQEPELTQEQLDIMLLKASENNNLNRVMHAINRGADVNVQNDKALILASQNGHLDIVRYLIENDADVNAQNDKALILASKKGHLDIVEYLIGEAGADVYAQNNMAFTLAIKYDHPDVVEYLKSQM